MNKVIMIGRLTNDPEMRTVQDTQNTGKTTTIAKFGYACARSGTSEISDFFNVTAFGKTAEWVEKYLRKGSKIALIGRLQSSKYEKNGETRYCVEIIAENIEFAESKADADARIEASSSYQPVQQGAVQLTPEQFQAAMAMQGVQQGMPQQQVQYMPQQQTQNVPQAMSQQQSMPQQQGTQTVQQMQAMPQQQSMPQQQGTQTVQQMQAMPQQQGTQTVQQMQAMPQQTQNVPQAVSQQQTAPSFGQGWS